MFKSLDMGTEVKRDIAESRRLMTYFNGRVIIQSLSTNVSQAVFFKIDC